jgi:hypothetical protein
MNEEQKAYAKKLQDLHDHIKSIQTIYDTLVKACKHLIVSTDFGGAYCDICGESYGWFCEKSPVKYCEYDKSSGWIDCKHCGEPESRK